MLSNTCHSTAIYSSGILHWAFDGPVILHWAFDGYRLEPMQQQWLVPATASSNCAAAASQGRAVMASHGVGCESLLLSLVPLLGFLAAVILWWQ